MATTSSMARIAARASTQLPPCPFTKLAMRPLPIRQTQQSPSTSRLFSSTPITYIGGYKRQGKPKDSSGIPMPMSNPDLKPSPDMPSFPYGPRHTYKRANRGLYGHTSIRFGNRVAEKYGNKSRRTWRPNVHMRRMYSASMQCFVQTMVTTRVMRTIDKLGGLDEYLLGSKAARIKELGVWGWKLRWRIMQTDAVKERFRVQKEALAQQKAPDGELIMGRIDTEAVEAIMRSERGEHVREAPTQQSITEMQKMLDEEKPFPLYGEGAADESRPTTR